MVSLVAALPFFIRSNFVNHPIPMKPIAPPRPLLETVLKLSAAYIVLAILNGVQLSFHKKLKNMVSTLNGYHLPFVFSKSNEIKDNNKAVKLYTRRGRSWRVSNDLKHPATFKTLAMNQKVKKGIIDDLERFVKEESYKRVRKAWQRGYLFYDLPGGIGSESSLISAIANYLSFDVYDLDLMSLSSVLDLGKVLVPTTNCSIIAIKGFDCFVDMQDQPLNPNKLMLSDFLNFIDCLWSSSGNDRIIVFTTNHRDRLDPVILRPVDKDIYTQTSSPLPLPLPGGGEIVQIDSSEKKALADSEVTKDRQHLLRAYQSVPVVSDSEKKNTREALKRECIAERLRHVDKDIYIQTFSPLPIPLPRGEIVQLDSSRKKALVDVEATNNRQHLLRAYQSGPVVFDPEKKNTREALKRECIAESVLCSVDSIDRKSFAGFDGTENRAQLVRAYQSGPIVSNSEKKNMGEALNRESSVNSIEDLLLQSGGRCNDVVKSFEDIYDLGFHMSDSLARMLKSPDLSRLLQINAVEQRVTKLPRYLGRFTAQAYSLRGEASVVLFGLSMEVKFESRLQLIHICQLARSSPGHLALLDRSEVVEPIALSSREFAATNNKADLVRQDQSGSTAFHSERKTRREISHREGITMRLFSLEDLQQHFGCKHKDAAKSLGVSVSPFKCMCGQLEIYLGPCQIRNNEEQSFDATNGRAHLVNADQNGPNLSNSEKKSKTAYLNKCMPILEDLLPHFGGRRKDAGKGLGDSLARKIFKVLETLPLWEQSDVIRHVKSWQRRMLKRCVRRKKLQDLPRTLQMNCSGGLTAQSGSSSHWPIGFPNGGHANKILGKTLKRKCRTMSVVSTEDCHQHFGARGKDAATSFGGASMAKRICGQNVINQVLTVKRIHRQHGIYRRPFRQGYSFGWERPVEVISLSMEKKLVSMLEFRPSSGLAISSPHPLALSYGGEIGGPIALSSSEFAATNNKAHPARQDRSGSTASQSEKTNKRKTSNGEGIAISLFSREDLQRNFGSKRGDVAKSLGVSVSTFKRICRHHGILRWPNPIKNTVKKPPDARRKKNLSPTCKTLSTNGQTEMENEMVGHFLESNEFLPNSIEGSACRDAENGIVETPTFHDSWPGYYADMGFSMSPIYKEIEEAGCPSARAFQANEQSTLSIAHQDPNNLVFPQPQIVSTEMLHENIGSPVDWETLLASLEGSSEPILEENVSESRNFVFPQPQIVSTVSTEMPSENIASPEDWEIYFTSLEGPTNVSGSRNSTVPTCFDSAPNEPVTTIPDTMPTIAHMMPHLRVGQYVMSVMLKVTYRCKIVKFLFPLTSGIIELKEEVSKRLKLQLGIFDIEYKDEEGDWILIDCNEDLRNHLQLFSSMGNQVIRFRIVDSDGNFTNFCETCRSLERKDHSYI